MRKNYILDANILIHDPQSIFHFADNVVVIPIAVLTELDAFKKEMTARGYNARAVVRLLDSLRNGQTLSEGVGLEGGGRLRVFCDADRLFDGSKAPADLEILRVARTIQKSEPQTPTVIVTKDLNLRIRADAVGLRAEDYESDRVVLTDLYTGQHEQVVPPEQIEAFKAAGAIDLPAGLSVHPNEYMLLRSEGADRRSALARVDASCSHLVALREPSTALCGVKPRNKDQYFAIDALLAEDVHLVTLMGKAGTGKTVLAMAVGMYLSLKKQRYRGLLVGRPVVPLGRDLGFLPGDIGQKLDPWMKPVLDTVEFLLDAGGPIHGCSEVEELLRTGLIEIQPLTYIRGRNIAKRFVIIDEAQNLTPLEVKTIITRLGQDAKIVLTGDPYQIDNPYIDASSNGFTYLVNRFRSQPIAAHVNLIKGERSALAELAANLL